MSAHSESEITLETPTGVIHGTLMMPEGAAMPVAVALIIAGSGPTDRDGNSPLLPGKNNSLRLIAELLADNGVASVRYDKRGVAASMASVARESDLRFTTYVDDAAAWLRRFERDARFDRLFVVGHSEGSQIGLLAAGRVGVAGVISLAGAGRPIGAVLREQLGRNLPQPLLAEAMRILAQLEAGRLVDSVPPSLAALFRPSVQPYMLSWLPLDPAAAVTALRVPILVIQGSTDVQTSPDDGKLLAGANAAARFELIDGMNHVLKEVTDQANQLSSYSDPTLPLHPELRKVIGEFVRRVR